MSTEQTADVDGEALEEDTETELGQAETGTAPGEEDEPEPVTIENEPPRLTQLLSVGGILLGVLLTVPFAFLAIPFGLAGFALFAASLFRVYSRGWLTFGTGLVLTGVLITGAYGAVQAELMLVAVGATVLAWDLGQQGISIGEQLGRNTKSNRLQLVHSAISAFVIGFISFVAYFVYLFMGDGRPAPAVALIVAGIVLFAWLYRS